MKVEAVKAIPVLVRLLPLLLLLVLLAAGIAQGGGYQGPADFDPA